MDASLPLLYLNPPLVKAAQRYTDLTERRTTESKFEPKIQTQLHIKMKAISNAKCNHLPTCVTFSMKVNKE